MSEPSHFGLGKVPSYWARNSKVKATLRHKHLNRTSALCRRPLGTKASPDGYGSVCSNSRTSPKRAFSVAHIYMLQQGLRQHRFGVTCSTAAPAAPKSTPKLNSSNIWACSLVCACDVQVFVCFLCVCFVFQLRKSSPCPGFLYGLCVL